MPLKSIRNAFSEKVNIPAERPTLAYIKVEIIYRIFRQKGLCWRTGQADRLYKKMSYMGWFRCAITNLPSVSGANLKLLYNSANHRFTFGIICPNQAIL